MKTKLAAMGGAPSQTFVDDVFSTWLYTGNGSTQTITNGIDLAGKGGLVWVKNRTAASTGQMWYDTARGAYKYIQSDSTGNEGNGSPNGLSAFTTSGFSVNGASDYWNLSANNYASWTFRKAAKFFDVVTYTGNGSARTIAHSLGVAAGMIIVKRTDTTGNWQVYHRGLTSAANSIQLNLTNAQASAPTVWNSTAPTSSVFSVGTDATVNASGGTYVAYLYAHDTSSTGIIQCGGYTGSASNITVTLGWEPQYVMVKNATQASNWVIYDTMRGMPTSGSTNPVTLVADTAAAENGATGSSPGISPTATGFIANVGLTAVSGSPGDRIIYMAIRMPNKPPTTGTQVYNAIARTGNATTTSLSTGFAPDLVIDQGRDGRDGWVWDKLRGVGKYLSSSLTNAEATLSDSILSFDNLGITVGTDTTGSRINGPYPYSNWFFKRAPGFFDEVCYTGTGVATTQAHNLGVVPELIIVKSRSASTEAEIYVASLGNDSALNLFAGVPASGAAFTTGGIAWNYTTPTSSVFSLGTWNKVNGSAVTFVAYLFATLAGISKVGSYTGNGTGQAIACGFGSGGARFVLIKRTDSAGDWYTYDSARGLTSGSSPYLLLNSTAAEVTGNNGVYASTGGFTLGATASTTTNISGASYIFLAVA